ncbi:MAG: nicotinate-nicotinamide nucleotide adenylyltransferase, partial [Anaerolineales bacterium]|nr:nicotinate-nicotinamide nucleotide adenylyltransferase [Anaerolineales bacterium]
TPLEHRWKMLALAIADNPLFTLSRVDIDRSPPHYAVDSVKIIKTLYPLAKIYYLMGGDSLRDLPRWHQPEQFINACDGIGVMRRGIEKDPLEELSQTLLGIRDKTIFLNAPQFDISSREIRQRVYKGLPFRYFLPSSVYRYILEKGLYR